MDYRKAHAAPKRIVPPGDKLQDIVLKTMDIVSRVVGSTLGPGGQPVLIERQDDLPPWITNDGVTVFKSLGFEDSVMQTVLEAYRQIAVRTANEAGDGTTTATILGAAIHARTVAFCRANPNYSPHRVMREMEAALRDEILPFLSKLTIQTSLETAKGRETLTDVATVSAHGDVEMAEAVMQCYEICGDEGNVTLVEASGPPRYEVEEVQGYPIPTGYEDGCGQFFGEFLREPSAHRTVLKAPMWLLYHGKLTEPEILDEALSQIKAQEGVWGQKTGERDVVVVAPFFSESVLGTLALNWKAPHSPKILPIRVPQSGIHGGQREFLDDLAAVVGAEVYDPITNPLTPTSSTPGVTFEGLGMEAGMEPTDTGEAMVWRGRTEAFEVGRSRASVIGYADPDAILLRTEELRSALAQARSKYESSHLTERIARLAGGIARLTIYGTSNGETSEKRDRAEDAVCAVRGALKHGALYGGSWGLLNVANALAHGVELKSKAVAEVLVPALQEPFHRLLQNVGVLNQDERYKYLGAIVSSDTPVIFDAMRMVMVDPRPSKKDKRRGIYDSAPAVIEALRSSLSAATLLGTLGAIVAYGRDVDYERLEAAAASQIPFDVNDAYSGGTAMAVS